MAVAGTDVLRVAVKWRNSTSGDVVNTFSLQVAAIEDGSDASALAAVAEWADDLYTNSGYTSAMADNHTHEDISVFNLSQGVPVGYVGALSALDGGNAQPSLPSTDAPLLVFRTPLPRFVGRKYLPTVGINYVNDGQVSSSLLTLLNAMITKLLNPYEAEGYMTLRYVVTSADLVRIQIPNSGLARIDFADMGKRKRGRGS